MSDVTLLTTEMHEALRAKYHEAWKLLQTAAPDVDQLNNAECEAWQRRRDTLLFHDEPMRCERNQRLEAALREIVAGLMPEDSAAYRHNRYELCAARLCEIARRAITSEAKGDDLNLQPIGKCDRCGRKVWKSTTLGQVDEMLQPGGGICGGRFVSLATKA